MQKILLFAVCFAALLFGCKKDYDITTETEGRDIPTLNVESRVIGSVRNLSGKAVQGATVEVGGITATTDKNGFFWTDKHLMNQNGALITVTKPGFFSASRFIHPSLGAVAKTDIVLVPKVEVSSFDATSGGIFTMKNTTVQIPANAIFQANGVPYTGTVKVYGYWLDPTNEATFRVMPGDLRAEDAEKRTRILRTFGMVRVELETPGGSALNIGAKNAHLSMAVPSAILGAAPADIPLWHFDEKTGYWKEEGSAKLVNGRYEGDVSHFSFWNCDLPANYIQLKGLLKDKGQHILGNTTIEIISQNYGTRYGYTNSNGHFGGLVPAGEVLTMKVKDACGTLVLTQDIGPFSTDTDLGVVTTNNTLQYQVIRGSLTDCANQPVSNGLVMVSINNTLAQFAGNADNTGHFEIGFMHCSAIDTCMVTAFDPKNKLQSSPLTQIFSGTALDVGVIPLCQQLDEYIIFQADGQEEIYVQPLEFLQDSQYVQITGRKQIGIDTSGFGLILHMNSGNQTGVVIYIGGYIYSPNISRYGCEVCSSCNCLPTDVQNATFTSFPTQKGEYAIGSVSGKIYSESKQILVPFSVQFRIKQR